MVRGAGWVIGFQGLDLINSLSHSFTVRVTVYTYGTSSVCVCACMTIFTLLAMRRLSDVLLVARFTHFQL